MVDERVPARVVRTRFPGLRDEQLRSLSQWRLVQPTREGGESWFSFADLATLRDVHEALARGVPLRAVVRELLAQRQGQLTLFDGASRDDTPRARVVMMATRASESRTAAIDDAIGGDRGRAEAAFERATLLDTGAAAQRPSAMAAYREALAFDPTLGPALINLGNLHYAEGHLPEAAALYEQATRRSPDAFEAWFNLGHTHHDAGRFGEAVTCYSRAIERSPDAADACFYLAVAYEKLGRSEDARPLWQRYQRMAPDGEWIALAREFSE